MKKVFLASFIVMIALAAFFIPQRAAAKLPAPNAALPQGAPVISCNSNDGRRNYCPADTRGGVQLVNQRSNSACVFNRTWGFDARRIWVDRGCCADFQANYYGPGIPSFPGYPPGGGGGGGGYNIYCSSDDGRRNFCATDASGGVSLARQRSNSPCIFGSSWGWDRRGIWVDRGCRADFTIGGNNWAPPNRPGVTVVSCSSDDTRRNNCNVNTSRGVRLIRTGRPGATRGISSGSTAAAGPISKSATAARFFTNALRSRLMEKGSRERARCFLVREIYCAAGSVYSNS